MVEFDTDDLEGLGVIATRTWTIYEKIEPPKTKKTTKLPDQTKSEGRALSTLESPDVGFSKKYGLIENHFKIKDEVKMNSHIAVGLDYQAVPFRQASHFRKSRPSDLFS